MNLACGPFIAMNSGRWVISEIHSMTWSKISNEYELSEIINIFGSIVSLATIFFLPKISLYLFCSYAYKVNFAGLLHG